MESIPEKKATAISIARMLRRFPESGIQGLRCSSRKPTALRAGKPFQ
jgi:hypothetical protein